MAAQKEPLCPSWLTTALRLVSHCSRARCARSLSARQPAFNAWPPRVVRGCSMGTPWRSVPEQCKSVLTPGQRGGLRPRLTRLACCQAAGCARPEVGPGALGAQGSGVEARELCSVWDCPGPGLEPVSPVLAAGSSPLSPQGSLPPRLFKSIFSGNAFPSGLGCLLGGVNYADLQWLYFIYCCLLLG